MELVIDNLFKSTYELYFRGVSEETVLEKINYIFGKFDAELVADAINIIKTSAVLGMPYEQCKEKVVSSVIKRFPQEEDIDLFILSLTLKVLIAIGSDDIDDLLNKPRDINKEVAAKYHRVSPVNVTDEMIETIKVASDNFTKQSYSITDPPVKNWDEYFYNVCRQVARNSKCLSRRIGAVLVWDKGIISTGYNGPPRGVPKCDMRWKLDKEFAAKYADRVEGKETIGVCPRHVIGFKSGEGLGICPAGHAERNALINAARKGIATKGTSLYMTCGVPCTPCLVEIINAGVKEIIVTSLRMYDESSLYLLNQSSLGIRLYDFVK